MGRVQDTDAGHRGQSLMNDLGDVGSALHRRWQRTHDERLIGIR